MSTLKVDAIRHNSATSDAITMASDGTCTAKITSINEGSALSHRNIVINGAMNVAQRSNVTSTSAAFQTVDRFAMYFTGTDENPTQVQFNVDPPGAYHLPTTGPHPYKEGFRKAYGITNGNQTSGAGAGDYIYISHKIEAQDMAQCGWNYTDANSFITLSFWVKSSVAQNFYGYLKAPDSSTSQHYAFETGALTAFTWKKVIVKIPGNSNLEFDTDTEANRVNMGLEIVWSPFFGTNYTSSGASLNTWGNLDNSARMPDYATGWYTTNDASFQITGVQLEVGDTATSFEHRTYVDELRRCSRYCQVWGRGYLIGNAVGSNDINIGVPLTTPLRTTPSANAITMHRSGNQNANCTFHSAQYTANSVVVEIRMGSWTGGSAVSDEVAYAVTPVSPDTMIISAEM
tara:strand:+ start:435 stop:1640 length:1206 start_codon:yes stop_codon:yes gene_type:complete